MKFQKTALKNGLRIVTVPMKNNPTVTFMVLVETGSEYETKKQNGISHFLEHMCFKGTKKRTQKEISHEFDSIGASNNAFTGGEYTGYHAKADFRHAGKILDMVSDIYLNPIFPEKDIEKEKGVVIEELRMYEDEPKSKVWDSLGFLMYGDQPAGRKIIGTEKSVRGIKRGDLVKYYREHYVPEATTIVAAGNLEGISVVREIEKRFGGIEKRRKKKKKNTKINRFGPRVRIDYKKGEQTHFVLGFNAFKRRDERRYALDVLNAVLGGGMSSRLFQKMRVELGICYYVSSFNSSSLDRGEFGVYAGVNNERFEEALLAIIEELRSIKNFGISDPELKKAKDFISGHFYMSLESSNSYADYYGFQEIYQTGILSPEEYTRKINKVKAAEIKKAASEVLKDQNMNLSVVGPVAGKSRLQKIMHF